MTRHPAPSPATTASVADPAASLPAATHDQQCNPLRQWAAMRWHHESTLRLMVHQRVTSATVAAIVAANGVVRDRQRVVWVGALAWSLVSDVATISEAASWLGVDRSRVRTLVRQGILTRVVRDGRIMVRMAEVSEL